MDFILYYKFKASFVKQLLAAQKGQIQIVGSGAIAIYNSVAVNSSDR